VNLKPEENLKQFDVYPEFELIRLIRFSVRSVSQLHFMLLILPLAALLSNTAWAEALPPLSFEAKSLGENTKSHKISALKFSGNVALTTNDLNAVAKVFIGQDLGNAESETLRQQLTKYYVERGFLFADIRVAPQADKNGVLVIEINEGRLAEIRIRGTEGLSPDYISKRLGDQAGPLNVNTLIDSYRLLLNDPLFKNINSSLLPGAEPGLALLDVEVVRAMPYKMDVYVNNFHPPAIGETALGVSGWLRNLTGRGDVLEFGAEHTQGSNPVNLSWSTPIATSTTMVSFSYSQGKSSVIEEPMRTINIESMVTRYELGISRPVVESLSRRVSLGLAYAEEKSATTLSGIPFSFTPGEVDGVTRNKTLRLSQDWSEVGTVSVFTLHSLFNFGRNNNQGGDLNAPDRQCLYWNGQASWIGNLLENGTQLVLRGTLQRSRNRLLSMDRSSIGGVNTVRGYRENQLVRDRSTMGSIELRFPILSGGKTGHSLQLVPFVDAGIGANQGESSDSLRSAGIGVNWRYTGWHADLNWASRLKSVPAPANQVTQDRGIHFQLGYNFF
jgi:hemolysin activation/secretion protein